ncbi:protein HESO1-like [Papaver somniferum]|uniref:protein HESO1-like n=1 Tax=Papaver somniferum TaxID=3469 RepID=UPI000E703670|nr:protein HESO1-like [Papaver somniferum]
MNLSSSSSYYSNGNGITITSSNTLLGRCLGDVLNVIKPLDGDVTARYTVINDLRAVVQSIPSLRDAGATVEPFGSFVSNLYTRWGDLDISIEIPCGDLVSTMVKNKKQKFLKEITKALRKRGMVRNLQLILQARVPLLIYETNLQNISCDISISNLLGQIKSKLFLWLTGIDGRFRDMILLIKEWAKAQQINDPKNGTLNSYSLCLLVIFHLQTCEPAIFPPLKDIYAGNVGRDLTGSRLTAERNIHDTCTANIDIFKRNSSGNLNQSSLPELFISFFQKFSRISVLASEYTICTYTGQWEYKRNNDKWTKDYPLLIEDPFEQPDNAARAVSMNQLPRISEAFERTHRSLVSSNQDRNSVIYGLVGRRVSSQLIPSHSTPRFINRGATDFPSLPRAPSPNEFYNRTNGTYPATSPSQNQLYNRTNETYPATSPSQNQLYNRTNGTYPASSVSIRRPMAPTTHFQSQQQRWEPKTTR